MPWPFEAVVAAAAVAVAVAVAVAPQKNYIFIYFTLEPHRQYLLPDPWRVKLFYIYNNFILILIVPQLI